MTIACCAAVRGEFKGPMFDLVEHSALAPTMTADEVDATSPVSVVDNTPPRRMDIVKTFSPHPRILHIGVKISLAAWVVSAMTMSIQEYRYQSFWLAYLTDWVIVVSSAYAILSAMSAVYLAIHPPASPDELEGGVGVLIKSTWALLAIAAPAQVMITILFWALEFKGTISSGSLMVHGIVMVLIMIDGFILSRIPLRMKQFALFESFAVAYVLWTVVHAYSGIGNPYADGETATQNDDAIYDSLAWKNDTAEAAIVSVIVLIVANPIIFMMCRALSRLLPRQLCEASHQESLMMSQL
jgi:hypothetical protein